MLRIFLIALVAMLSLHAAIARDVLPDAKPVPAMQVLPLPDGEDSFQYQGRELTRYYHSPTIERPFLYPLNGPSGRSLTRMGHPHDPITHSHHNSFWVSHYIVDGTDFWGDRNKGRIVHERVERYDDADDAASLVALNAWKKTDGTVLMRDRRQVRVEPLDRGQWLLTLDLELFVDQDKVTLGKTPFGIVGVRMAKTIGVNDGGGRIRNSEGNVDEQGENGVFWKHARWCDYSGPITNEAIEGITLFDHPSNPNHPTAFHVRNDGWMGACLTFDADREIVAGTPLMLRYGLYVHAGLPSPSEIGERWKAFAETEPPATLAPLKKNK
ncbi:MAG TPA: PmoA family protein [Pirellulales bacterium]|nr:PmoA family protein [Pirellulales bacterium]